MIIFNLQKGSIDLKKRFRSAKKKAFTQASTLKKINQIGASSGLPVEIGCMCCCEKLVKISFTMSFNSGDHRHA